MKQITIITGASRGVGKSLAEKLCKQTNICIIARTKTALEKTKKELERNNKHDVLAFCGDVSDEKFVDATISKIAKEYEITCLINNAGTGKFGLIENNNRQMIDEVFSAIVFGTILMSSKVLTYMRKSKKICKIVNIISQSGMRAFKFESVYCAAKFAQKGFAECLRAETFGTNIKVMNVFPGGIDSPFWDENRNYVNKDVQKTFASTDEVASIIVDCISNKETLVLKDLVFEQTHMNLE